MKIYEKIRMHCESKNETAASISREYGMTQQAISNYFTGKNAMPLDFLVWYIEKNPEIDVNALFNKKKINIVAEEKTGYRTEAKKQHVIDRIVAVLEDEL